MIAIKNETEYSYLQDELVRDGISKTSEVFDEILDCIDEFNLHLSEDDFKRLFYLGMKDSDIKWIMYKMDTFELELVDALVLYVTH